MKCLYGGPERSKHSNSRLNYDAIFGLTLPVVEILSSMWYFLPNPEYLSLSVFVLGHTAADQSDPIFWSHFLPTSLCWLSWLLHVWYSDCLLRRTSRPLRSQTGEIQHAGLLWPDCVMSSQSEATWHLYEEAEGNPKSMFVPDW